MTTSTFHKLNLNLLPNIFLNILLITHKVNKGVEASLVQLLETGLLHADPHPGNLRYTLEGRVG
jgi:hypothetical protein